MNFKEAFDAMKHGKKVKLPWWDGYWAWEHGDIIMHCRDGVARSIMESELPEFTYMNIASDEFEVVEESDKGTSDVNVNKSFVSAFHDVLNGSCVSRKSWNEKSSLYEGFCNRYIAMEILSNGTKIIKEYRDIEGTKSVSNYYPSGDDMFAQDWFIYKSNKNEYDTFDVVKALKHLRKGRFVKRLKWNLDVEHGEKIDKVISMSNDIIYLHIYRNMDDKTKIPYKTTHRYSLLIEDMTANDWVLVN